MEKIILEIIPPHANHPQRYVVRAGRATLGRGYRCDVILEDPYVSAEHAEIFLVGDGFVVRDAGSENGLFVGRCRMESEQIELQSGQEFRIGKTRIRVFSVLHPVPPVMREGWFGGIRDIMDRRISGFVALLLVSLLAIMAGQILDSEKTNYWNEQAVYWGLGAFSIVLCMTAFIHIYEIVIKRKVLPWSRLSVFVSLLIAVGLFWTVIAEPLIYFQMTSSTQISVISVLFLLVFLLVAKTFLTHLNDEKFSRWAVFRIGAGCGLILLLLLYAPEYNAAPQYPSVIYPGAVPLTHVSDMDLFLDKAQEVLKTGNSGV